jgi:hemoglobin
MWSARYMGNASLFDRLGGETAIEAAVIAFYAKVMTDPSISGFFAGYDIHALIKKQVAFMTMAFGGPSKYSGRDLRHAHAGLVRNGLADQHFDAVAGHLRTTLDELGVDAATTAEVLAIVGGTRPDVLAGNAP